MINPKINQAFLEAISRIESKTATHPKLIRAQLTGNVKLNATNVALEAGHSRTHIATEDSQYTEVRRKIYLTSIEPVRAKPSPPLRGKGGLQAQVVRLIRERDAEVLEKRIMASRLAEAEMKIHQLNKKLNN